MLFNAARNFTPAITMIGIRPIAGGTASPKKTVRILSRAKRALDYWRELARFARRLTPVLQSVAQRRTFVLQRIIRFTENGLIDPFRASRCQHRVPLGK